MRFATFLRSMAGSMTGWYIRRYPPLGTDKFHDLGLVWPLDRFKIVLDVGANIGQSALVFARAFPRAAIHCFEPVPSTFATLRKTLTGPRFHLNLAALGAINGTLTAQVTNDEEHSDMNSLNGPHPFLRDSSFRSEEITVMRLDDWCRSNGMEAIDYLKIDTEGYDLEVLKGGNDVLRQHRVRYLEVEVAMNPGNTFHVPFGTVVAHLAGYGYHLFGLYEQLHEDPVNRPILRRVNAVFTPIGHTVGV